MNPLKILIAEDNPDDLFLVRQAFNKAEVTGHIQVVVDGAEALAYLNGEGAYADRDQYPFPDVLLLDLNMPGIDGFEVLERLRQDPLRARLIIHVLTTSSRERDIQRVYSLGANSYVLKPSRMDELVAFAAALREWHRFVCLPGLPCQEALA
jgi:CheY-like chemotaxis protein